MSSTNSSNNNSAEASSSVLNPVVLYDLATPLLQQSSDSINNDHVDDNYETAASDSMIRGGFSSPMRLGLKLAAMVLGSLVAYASQHLLLHFLWNDAILVNSESSVWSVIVFSLHWSFWTCVCLLGTLMALSNGMEHWYKSYYYYYYAQGNRSNNAVFLDDDLLFLLESHYVVGALLTISAVWVFDTTVTHSLHRDQVVVTWSSALLTAFILVGYAIGSWWTYCCLTNNGRSVVGNAESTMSTTTNAHSSWTTTSGGWGWYWNAANRWTTVMTMLTGFVVGGTSQSILCYFLWNDHDMRQPAISSLVLFSLLWSALTVCMTALGCYVLTSSILLQRRRAKLFTPTTTTTMAISQQRTVLRMEAVYIGCCLVGICSAWIWIDIMHHMMEQVVPSLILLFVSMVAFSTILQCFPEDSCLEEAPCGDAIHDGTSSLALTVHMV
jgi:hypothetical protein